MKRNNTPFLILIAFVLWTDYILLSSAKGGGGGGRGGGRGGGNPGAGGRPANTFGGSAPQSGNTFGGQAPAVSGSKSNSFGGRNIGTGLAAGAAGGLAGGLLGAALAHQIAQGSTGGYHGGQYYYYGDRNYPGPGPGMVKCTLKVPNEVRANSSDGTSATEIVYDCNRATHTCCSNGCCPLNNGDVSSVPLGSARKLSLWSILIPLLVLLLVVGIVCFFVYKCIRRRREEAGATQTVHYETAGGQQTVMQGPDKQWVGHPQQPPYPAGPMQAPYGYPQSPPPAYANYGFQAPPPMQHQPQQLYTPH